MQSGETALHTAARNDNSEAVELLLQLKASVDIQDRVIRGVVGARRLIGD